MASLTPAQLNNISPYALTERLWFNTSDGTNYQLWKKHVRHHFQRQDLLRFIDDADSNPTPPETIINQYNSKPVSNPDYVIWKRIDQSLKQRILSLLVDDVIAPGEVDTIATTSRELWSYLEEKFREHQHQLANGSVIDANTQHVQLLRDWDEYSKLYSAALLGDQNAGQQIFSTVEANKMNSRQAMALHVAVGSGKIAIDFVRNLVCRMPNDLISVKDAGGNTALSIAAAVGNIAAAKILVANNSNLLYVPNISGDFPVHIAAKHSKRVILIYLISVTKDDHTDQNPYEGYNGLALLTSTIEAGFFDIALFLVKKYPYLATLRLSANSALKSIVEQKYRDDHVQRPNLFGVINLDHFSALMHPKDIDNIESLYISPVPVGRFLAVSTERLYRYYKPLKRLMMTRKLLVIEIVKFLCEKMKKVNFIKVEEICRDAILIAAKLGNHEIVEEILEAFPCAIHCSDPSFLKSIIHVAVENRCICLFNNVYRRSDHTLIYLDVLDNNGNNLLHSVAKLAPAHKLNKLSNAALGMQYEMQWYKEVEKLIHPRSREQLNSTGKTPRMIFENEHKKLRDEGEKWVKDTVNMCTITAALISTIMFAAAITVPGGNDSSTGMPFFATNPGFIVFGVSDAISLITSASSLLLFLHIFTSRYKEDDFLYSILEVLVYGLWCFIVSITSMMLTFGATLYIELFEKTMMSLCITVMGLLLIVAIFWILLSPLRQDFAKLLNMNQGFLGEKREPNMVVISSGNEGVFDRKVASHESV